VSRHLSLLKDVGLVVEERAGGFSYYRLAPFQKNRRLAATWASLGAHFRESADPVLRADDAGLADVRRVRRENFETHGNGAGQLVPGRSWAAWARALGHLLPPVRVADIGCGDGYLTVEAARWARQVIGVDRSAAVLARARALARRRGVRNIVWKRGEIENLPLKDRSVDVALLSQALHHAADPAKAVAEAVRILTPGGRVLLLDLAAHDETWVRERVGDRWLGFSDDTLRKLLRGAGLHDIKTGIGSRRKGDPFAVVLASGTRERT
jgi:ArsR family transcriptional regulator